MRRLGDAAAGAIALGVLLALVACSATVEPSRPSNTGPLQFPDQPVSVQTPYDDIVLDDGTGPVLCRGLLRMSLPPQCGGPTLIGWNWADWEGQFEEASGVRWGEFWVAGSYDPVADTLTVQQADLSRERPDYVTSDFSSACTVPEGGWQVLDAATTTDASLQSTLQKAAGMVGYAGAWVDRSPNPANPSSPPTNGSEAEWIDWELSLNDPMLLILNIRTTGDVSATEAALRETWGGMLCVSAANQTEQELLAIQQSIMAEVPRPISSGINSILGIVEVRVVWDDGSLQRQLDDRYGPGIVQVSSFFLNWP